MQFILVKSKEEITNEEINIIKKKFEETTSILCEPNTTYEWKSNDNHTYFIGKNPNLTIYNFFDTFSINQNNELSFIHGWVKKNNEDYLLNAKDVHNLDNQEDLDGLFVAGKIDSIGNGEFLTSLFSPELYYAISDEKFAISNRIFTLSEVFNYKKLNKKHLATHIQYQHKSITYDTIFNNIQQIPFGTKIFISNELKFERKYDLFYNEKLEKQYLEDPKSYWDDCLNKVKSQVNAFVNLGIKDKLKVGISGGMDSRLLFSLYYKHISSTFSWGPAYSPEVIAGRMCANTMNIPHETPSLKNAQSTQNLLNLFPQHLFAREFEMCPWDFGRLYNESTDTITVDGQEFIKTLPYNELPTKDQILTQVNREFESRSYAIPKKYYEEMLEENQANTLEFLNHVKNIQKFPFINRVLNRGRWAARVHETILDHSFNIYPLLTNTFLQYAYNSSINSLKNQEIVYEMVKRSAPELLEIPLFNKSYPQKFVPPLENKVPGKINYKYEYLIKYFKYLKQFILDNYNLVSDLVEKDFVENLSIEKLNEQKIKYDESLPQVIYTLLQTIILIQTNEPKQLKNNFKYKWEIETDNIDDTYDEDCLKAIVEYNKEITELKIKNKEYEQKINNLEKESLKNKNILFLGEENNDDLNFKWNDRNVIINYSEEKITIIPNSGNWFSPMFKNIEYFLPSKFRLDMDLIEFSPSLRAILLNDSGESFSKQLNIKNNIGNNNHLTIIYDEGEINYIIDDISIKEKFDLKSNNISIRFDLWGYNKLVFKDFTICGI